MKKITEEDIPLWSQIQDGSYTDKWIEIGLTVGPRVSDEAVKKLLDHCDLPCTRILWALDAVTAWRAGRVVLAGHDPCPDGGDIDRKYVDWLIDKHGAPPLPEGSVRYGQHDASWVSYYMAYEGACAEGDPPLDLSELLLYVPIVTGAGWFVHVDTTVILSQRVDHQINARGNLHCVDGPAIWDFCFLDGIQIPRELEWLVYEPTKRTQKSINDISNAELRRVVIATFPDDYIQGEPTARDGYGELYPIDDEMALVRVLDASTDRVYWLRVPPEITTPHEAVAWSFGMTADEYSPEIQT